MLVRTIRRKNRGGGDRGVFFSTCCRIRTLLFYGCLDSEPLHAKFPHPHIQWSTSHSVPYTGSTGSLLDSMLYPWLPNLEKEWCRRRGLVEGCCLLLLLSMQVAGRISQSLILPM